MVYFKAICGPPSYDIEMPRAEDILTVVNSKLYPIFGRKPSKLVRIHFGLRTILPRHGILLLE